MTATAHALVGGAIAAAIPDPVLGVTLAVLSHPVLDAIPHWDFGWGWRKKSKKKLFTQALLDLLLGTLLTLLIFSNLVNIWYLLFAIAGAVAWDIIQVPYWLLNWKFPPFSWIYQIQHHIQGKARLPWGILTQVVTVVVVFTLLQILK